MTNSPGAGLRRGYRRNQMQIRVKIARTVYLIRFSGAHPCANATSVIAYLQIRTPGRGL